MKNWKLLCILGVLLMTSCKSANPPYKNGDYTASQANFDEVTGWKDTIFIHISGGKINSVDWNSISKDGGDDKKTLSREGKYVMTGDAQWHEQARVLEDLLISVQDPDKINLTSSGYVDGVTGVTIHALSFVTLAKEALQKAR